jgi:hypothetical protein
MIYNETVQPKEQKMNSFLNLRNKKIWILTVSCIVAVVLLFVGQTVLVILRAESISDYNKGTTRTVPVNKVVLLQDFSLVHEGEEYNLSEIVWIKDVSEEK